MDDIPIDKLRADRRREAFFRAIKQSGVPLTTVAKQAGVPISTLYSYRQGTTAQLRSLTEARLADVLGMTTAVLFNEERVGTVTVVEGRIGVLGDVTGGKWSAYEVELPLVPDGAGHYRAFELDGLYMPPAETGWIIVFREDRRSPEHFVGRPCLCVLADHRMFFRRLRHGGFSPPVYSLDSWSGAPSIDNVEVVQALPFLVMTPAVRTSYEEAGDLGVAIAAAG